MPHLPIAVYVFIVTGALVIAYGAYIAMFAPIYSTGRAGDDEVESNGFVGLFCAIVGCVIIGATLFVQYDRDTHRYAAAARSAAHRWEHQTGNTVVHIDARAKSFDYVPRGKVGVCTGGTLKPVHGSYRFVPQTATCSRST